MIKSETGYDIEWGSWRPSNDTNKKKTRYMVRFGHVYAGQVCLGSCPGVMTLREWNRGKPKPILLKRLAINHILALGDLGLAKQNLPPYDGSPVTKAIQKHAKEFEKYLWTLSIDELYS